MFEVLLASAQPHVVKPGRLLGSLLTHVVTIGFAVDATRAAPDNRMLGAVNPVLVMVREAPFSVRKPEKRAPAQPVARPKPKAKEMSPAPKGFKTVVAPEDIPFIPPIDLHEKPFDPRDYTGRGVEGGTADGVVGGTGRTIDLGKHGGGVVYVATNDDWRFQQAVLISQPEPRYPATMAAMGLSGRVLLRFVIDTTGKVDKRSIQVVENTEKEFVPPARDAVARAVFRPARVAGNPVRQLAEQSIRFVVRN
jgi:TonB family protein